MTNCELCAACGSPLDDEDAYCGSCGHPHQAHLPSVARLVASENRDEFAARHFQCKSCGSTVAIHTQQRSYTCPFCGSNYVVQFTQASTGRQQPEYIIAFAVSAERAYQRFRQWVGRRSWLRPGDLARATIREQLTGVYMPFWLFSALAESRWSARIGEYWYRTETYTTKDAQGRTVVRTRQVRETEWWPLAGQYHRYYSGHLVSASHGLPQQDADRLEPYRMAMLKRYQPHYLPGWLCEEYSLDQDAIRQLCLERLSDEQRQHISHFMPGDTHAELCVETSFSHIHADLCLLPAYVWTYRYKDRVYRVLINGQTGEVVGDKPISKLRVGLLILAVLILVGLVALLFAIGG